MSKAFVKESEFDEELAPETGREAETLPAKNYITPAGFRRLDEELRQLSRVERPKVVEVVAWAAGNGDRSENGDYLYGKKRLREIDRRVRFLIKRLESAEVVDNAGRDGEQVFFGARVRVRGAGGGERTVTILGADEVDPARGRISWHSPIARALLKARDGDVVRLEAPGGAEQLEILEVDYPAID